MTAPPKQFFTLKEAMARGDLEMARGRFERAADLYGQLIAAKPDYVPALAEGARSLHRLCRFDEAARLLRAAVAQAPGEGRLIFNQANALRASGRQEAAITLYRRAHALDPRREEMNVGLGLALMQAGRWAEGMAFYEQRSTRRAFLKWARQAGMAVWDGGPVAGRRILLVAEQGAGDVIHFVRYAHTLAQHGATVVVNAHPPLRRLLTGALGVSAVADTPVDGCDMAELLLSLPARFASTPDSVPAPIPYLTAPARPVVTLPDRGRPRVGLVWAGNPKHAHDGWRTVPFDAFRPLLDVGGMDFYALQKGEGEGETDPRMTALGPALTDFADTASVVAALDLVVTVDTSVAHLAGALGKPVWILLGAQADWRWLRERTDTPWYPTARLFRQQRLGDWTPVVGAVAAALAAWRG